MHPDVEELQPESGFGPFLPNLQVLIDFRCCMPLVKSAGLTRGSMCTPRRPNKTGSFLASESYGEFSWEDLVGGSSVSWWGDAEEPARRTKSRGGLDFLGSRAAIALLALGSAGLALACLAMASACGASRPQGRSTPTLGSR